MVQVAIKRLGWGQGNGKESWATSREQNSIYLTPAVDASMMRCLLNHSECQITTTKVPIIARIGKWVLSGNSAISKLSSVSLILCRRALHFQVRPGQWIVPYSIKSCMAAVCMH
jgi:hypothetical protein